MLQCSLYFAGQEGGPDHTKIHQAQFINLLTDKALAWATAVRTQGGEHTALYEHFLQLFQSVFNHSPERKEMGEWLLALKQGSLRAAEYALSFYALAAGIYWNEPAFKVAYCQGLNEERITKMACQDDQATLDPLIDMSICLDNLKKSRRVTKATISPVPEILASEPIQLSQVKLTFVECQRHQKEKLCFHCCSPEHQVAQYSSHPSARVPQSTPEQAPFTSHSTMVSRACFLSHLNFVMPVQIVHSGNVSSILVLNDSGAPGNFTDHNLDHNLTRTLAY